MRTMSYDVSDDPAYNPFAEGNQGYERPALSQGFYTSAFLPSLTNARWPSPSKDDEEAGRRVGRNGNLRARSEVQVVPPNSAGLHPLKSALFAAVDDSFSDNTHVTRPNLSRIVNGGRYSPSSKDEVGESSSNKVDVANEEKDVIVHHVTAKDSLAGVALKYGITLANLRRANQLWMSDSIHRRSVLYIPIESASRAQEYIPGPKHTPAATPDGSEEVMNVFDEAYSSPSSFDGDKSDDGFTINVARVPAKQLTYFPPSSSTKNLDSRPSRHSLDNLSSSPASSTRISPSSSSKYDPSPLNNSLTSFFTALPIAASTRDELITRLSLDSVSSTHSDTSRHSPGEVGHELYEVRKLNGRGRTRGRPVVSLSNDCDAGDTSSPTPRARPQNNSLPPSPTTSRPGHIPKSSHVHSISSCSPPQFYVSQPHETFVRTLQPEPSPAMEIPLRRSNTLGAASGRKLHTAFGTERQSRASKERVGVKDIDLHSLVRRMKLQDYEP